MPLPVRSVSVSVQPLSQEVYNEEVPPRAKAAKKADAKAAAKAAAAKAAKDALFGIGQASHSSNPTQSAAMPSLQEEATVRAKLAAERVAVDAILIPRIEAGEDPIKVLEEMTAKRRGVPPASSESNAKAEEQKNGDDVD